MGLVTAERSRAHDCNTLPRFNTVRSGWRKERNCKVFDKLIFDLESSAQIMYAKKGRIGDDQEGFRYCRPRSIGYDVTCPRQYRNSIRYLDWRIFQKHHGWTK